MRYSFFALISRMKNISRWSLMRNNEDENVQEHSHQVAVIAHGLAVIRRDVLGKDSDPDKVAVAALFHDASEILTGDMPTPIKYFSPEIMAAYKRVEALAASKLISTLPAEMRQTYMPLLSIADENVRPLIKAADALAAYIKCLEELKAGNLEFKLAAEQTRKKLASFEMPEIEYFMEFFIPAFDLTLDELDLNLE